ncbi:MAG: hypothetical protein QW175_04450 [Candidatus Bathyarchaeia archaeon]
MSYKEWVSSNGRGRIRIYGDDMLCRFNMKDGSMAYRQGNVMVEHEDYQTNQRTIIIAEKCVWWEEENNVYIQFIGRRVIHTELLSTRRTYPTPQKNRRPIEVHGEF